MLERDQLLFFSMGIGMTCASACAAPATTTWTSYLYEGPSHHYSVLDEVPQGTIVDAAGCDGAWCKITFGRRAAYLPAEILARANSAKPDNGLLPQPAAALDPRRPPGPCVKANQTGGNGGNAMTWFCLK